MDIKQIQYFIEVSNTGSFTAAAKRLYLSVPGLVKTIDRLETELGVSLFVRMRSGVTLTPAGQVLARYAPSYIRKHEMIISNVRKAALQRETRVEVCMTWGLLSFFPRNFLSRFVLGNPDASLATHNYSLKELHEALREYRETIGLYFGEIDDPDMEILFHRGAPLHALMADSNPLCAKETLSLKDLKYAKVVLVNSDPGVMQQLQSRLESVGCPPQIILDGSEWEQAMELVASAGYISFCLPPRNLGSIALQTRCVDDLGLIVNFNMAIMKGVAMTDAERRFVNYVMELMNANR
ncbi:MAG: LysR family transcriptional regulator [Clostridia bacterium]|nr:LysR family transcriptional regulator [Clostridia bacterium]